MLRRVAGEGSRVDQRTSAPWRRSGYLLVRQPTENIQIRDRVVPRRLGAPVLLGGRAMKCVQMRKSARGLL